MGMTWADLLGMYMQYRAADKASDQKPQYSISPQMDELFKKMMGLVDYSPTRDYISSYADSYIKSVNAPGGMASWKPTYQSDYMKNQPALPNTAIDITKVGNGVMNGDKNNLMPWNYGYTGPGLGGKTTKPPGAQGSLYGGSGGGGRGPMQQDMNGVGDINGGWSQDYYNNSFNGGVGYSATNPNSPDYRGPQAPNGAYDGIEPRDQYGQLLSTMNTMSPQAAQQYQAWWGGLSPEQRQAEQAKAARLDQFVVGLGGNAVGYVKNAVKEDPLGFGAALMSASASGGMSLVLFFAGRGIDKVMGAGFDAIKNGISNIFGGGGQTQQQPPPTSPWGKPGGAV